RADDRRRGQHRAPQLSRRVADRDQYGSGGGSGPGCVPRMTARGHRRDPKGLNMTKFRRVVTGQNADGKSVFVSDEEVDPVTLALLPGYEFHRIWAADEAPTLPTDGQQAPAPAYFPPASGYRFGFFTVPPAGVDLP